jgi:pyrroloquinoline quinone biosynthesis protein D
MSGRAVIIPHGTPALKRGVRRHFDTVRNQHILQGPERIIVLDDIACAILDLCDGTHTVQAMAAALALQYQGNAAEIEADVTVLLQELADKGLLKA